jgi:hypothetical protein
MRLRRSSEGPATTVPDGGTAAAVWDGELPKASGQLVIKAPKAADAATAPAPRAA